MDQHSLPDDFPAALAETAERMVRMLGAIHARAFRDRSPPPTLHRVGLVMRNFPDVDHEALGHRLELWAVKPSNLRKGDAVDLVSAFFSACERASRSGNKDRNDGAPVQTSDEFLRSFKDAA